jgi:hypothetical protein
MAAGLIEIKQIKGRFLSWKMTVLATDLLPAFLLQGTLIVER